MNTAKAREQGLQDGAHAVNTWVNEEHPSLEEITAAGSFGDEARNAAVFLNHVKKANAALAEVYYAAYEEAARATLQEVLSSLEWLMKPAPSASTAKRTFVPMDTK